MEFFALANYVEAAIWAGMAVYCATRAAWQRSRRLWVLAVSLLLFGVSDVIEVQTGAWYRPWWLLAWKGLCLMVMVIVLGQYLHDRLKRR